VTFITTSTVVVAPTAPAHYKRYAVAKCADRCPDAGDTGLSCRMVQYDTHTIVEACIVFYNVQHA
jgi:hypothetical protein